jgi:hypothetical protein
MDQNLFSTKIINILKLSETNIDLSIPRFQPSINQKVFTCHYQDFNQVSMFRLGIDCRYQICTSQDKK